MNMFEVWLFLVLIPKNIVGMLNDLIKEYRTELSTDESEE